MVDIFHKIVINAPSERIYAHLSSIEGLASWWTSTTTGESASGGTIRFAFGEHVIPMRVQNLERHRRVAWECVDTLSEWSGTRLSFDLAEEGGRTTLRFRHANWKEQSDFMGHCSMKWATFLLSLRELSETGKGRPYPHDVPV